MKKDTGRPSKFTPEIANEICELISTTSMSLRAIAALPNMPALSTICKWIAEKETFSEQYARAKTLQADILASEIIEISDNETRDLLDGEFGQQGNTTAVQRDKLRVDARKWAASKLAPKKYGDKLDVTTNGKTLPTSITIIQDNGSDSRD